MVNKTEGRLHWEASASTSWPKGFARTSPRRSGVNRGELREHTTNPQTTRFVRTETICSFFVVYYYQGHNKWMFVSLPKTCCANVHCNTRRSRALSGRTRPVPAPRLWAAAARWPQECLNSKTGTRYYRSRCVSESNGFPHNRRSTVCNKRGGVHRVQLPAWRDAPISTVNNGAEAVCQASQQPWHAYHHHHHTRQPQAAHKAATQARETLILR